MQLFSRPKTRVVLFVLWCLAWPGIAAALLMPLPAPMMSSDLLGHFLVFGGMAAGIIAFSRTILQVLSFALVTVAGSIALEFAQAFVPYRSFDLIDIAANVVGATIGTIIAIVMVRLLPPTPGLDRPTVEASQL